MSAQTTSVVNEHSSSNVTSQNSIPLLKTNDEKVLYLAQETGMELVLAEEYLASNNWNISEALKGYSQLVEEERNRKANRTKTNNVRQLGRGLSVSNVQLVQEAREKLTIDEKQQDYGEFDVFDPSSNKTFLLPDISKFPKDLATFIREDLISVPTLQALTSTGRLNWWAEIGACRKLFPLSTVGDGNCLLHAASLGMWGFHDRMLTLRKALHHMLLHPLAKKALKRRWKYNLWKENMECGGLTYTRDEWEDEWKEIVKLASERPRRIDGGIPNRRISRSISFRSTCGVAGALIPQLREGESLDSLEAIHVYVLANLLCRPIIVISEDMLKDSEGRDVAPIPFGGVYLPLERKMEACWKYPLVLAYDASHFSALVPSNGETFYKGMRLSNSVPLFDRSLMLLPVRFAIDPGATWDLVQDDSVKEERPELIYQEKIILLRKYLDVVKVTIDKKSLSSELRQKHEKDLRVGKSYDHKTDMFVGQPTNEVIAAKLSLKELPKHYHDMIDNYLHSAQARLNELIDANRRPECLSKNCKMTSAPECNGYCLACQEKRGKLSQPYKTQHETQKTPGGTYPTTSDGLVNRSVTANSPAPNSNVRSHTPSNINVNEVGRILYKNVYVESPSPSVAKFTVGTSQHIPNNPGPTSGDRVIPITDVRKKQVDEQTFLTKNYTEEYRNIGRNCRSPGCRFYGNDQTQGFCSSCYRQYMKERVE